MLFIGKKITVMILFKHLSSTQVPSTFSMGDSRLASIIDMLRGIFDFRATIVALEFFRATKVTLLGL